MSQQPLTRRVLLRRAALLSLTGLVACTEEALGLSSSPSEPTITLPTLAPYQPDRNEHYDVIVVGAGMAGLAAAQQLHNEGYRVIVLEGRARLGGRIWTSHQWPEVPLDLGASWIHGTTGNPLSQLADEIGAERQITDSTKTLVLDAKGEEIRAQVAELLAAMEELIDDARAAAEDGAVDLSLSAAINDYLAGKRLSRDEQIALNFTLASTIEHEYAGDRSQLSSWWFDESQQFGGDEVIFAKGYTVLIEYLARNLTIAYEAIVTQLFSDDQGVTITSIRSEYRADAVLVTLPLGVLKTGQISFQPALPQRKQRAIAALGVGTLNKLYLRFERSFWPTEYDWINYLNPNNTEWVEWVSFATALGTPVLLGFNAGDEAVAMEQRSDEAIVASALATLRTMFGQVPEPLSYQISRWHSDPFAGGSYSCYLVGSEPAMRVDLAEPAGCVFFAGEATSREHPATAHGAYLSGLRAAKELSEFLAP